MTRQERQRKDILRTTQSSFRTFGVPPYLKAKIIRAFTDSEWDFLHQYNGASGIKEGWVNYYHPVFVWHDYAMQNRERLKDKEQTMDDYVHKVGTDLMKMLEVYKYPLTSSWWKSLKISLLSYIIGWKIFKR